MDNKGSDFFRLCMLIKFSEGLVVFEILKSQMDFVPDGIQGCLNVTRKIVNIHGF